VLQEVDHLGDLALGALVAGDVGEPRGRAFAVVDLGPGATDPADAAGHGALGPAADVQVDPDQQQERRERQDHPDQRGFFCCGGTAPI